MAQQTRLSTIATPGRTTTFVAKTAAIGGPGTRRMRQIKSLTRARNRRRSKKK